MITKEEILEKIEELHQSPIYAMSLCSKELFHSNFWAWLMEQDEAFIEIFFTNEGNKELSGIGREDGNRDITIYRKNGNPKKQKPNDVYVIENKLKSIPTVEQLDTYKQKIDNENWGVWKGGVLTGIKKPSFELPDGWSFLPHKEIANKIMVTAQNSSADTIKNSIEIIKQYCEVLSNICDILEYTVDMTDNIFEYDVDELNKIRISDIAKKMKAENFLVHLRKFLKERESELPTVYNEFTLKTGVSFNNGKATIDVRYSSWYHDDQKEWFCIGVQIEEYQYRRLVEQDKTNSTLESLYDKYKIADIAWFDDEYDKEKNRKIFNNPTTMKPRGNKKYNKYEGSYNFVYQYYDLFKSVSEDKKEYYKYEEVCQLIYEDLKKAYDLIKK
jgi:hypothetical protein